MRHEYKYHAWDLTSFTWLEKGMKYMRYFQLNQIEGFSRLKNRMSEFGFLTIKQFRISGRMSTSSCAQKENEFCLFLIKFISWACIIRTGPDESREIEMSSWLWWWKWWQVRLFLSSSILSERFVHQWEKVTNQSVFPLNYSPKKLQFMRSCWNQLSTSDQILMSIIIGHYRDSFQMSNNHVIRKIWILSSKFWFFVTI